MPLTKIKGKKGLYHCQYPYNEDTGEYDYSNPIILYHTNYDGEELLDSPIPSTECLCYAKHSSECCCDCTSWGN